MRRYTVLGVLYIINAALGGLIKKGIEKIHPYLHKQFVFRTSFGTFLGATVNQWTVLAPDYEPEIQKVIRNCTEKTPISERVIINIGAHIGRYAIGLVKNDHYTAYCFEPNPATFRTLQVNTLLSKVESKCFLYNYALGNKDTELEFEHVAYNDGSSRIVQGEHNKTKKKQLILVPVKVFDQHHADIEPSLIIMDVEGFELEVLKGMSNSLDRYRSVDLIIEIFAVNPKKDEIIRFLTEKGFSYTPIDKDNYHFTK